jgi:peptidoglycan-N-acetylglucosamine deacetylase
MTFATGVLLAWSSGAAVAVGAQAPPPQAAKPAPSVLRPIRNMPSRASAVALTFDACATSKQDNGFDRPIFEILKREQVPATIFVSGRWVEAHPDAMAELAGEPLIEFGDHSYGHPRMSRLNAGQIAAEIDQTEEILARYGKRSVAFRPPFGDWNHLLAAVALQKQLPLVTWDVVSGDPSAKTTKERMIRGVLDKARSGSIVVFHINGRGVQTAAALPEILRGLRERGFRFVLVSELLAPAPPAPVAGAPVPIGAATASTSLPPMAIPAAPVPTPTAHVEP